MAHICVCIYIYIYIWMCTCSTRDEGSGCRIFSQGGHLRVVAVGDGYRWVLWVSLEGSVLRYFGFLLRGLL